ncbi:hypothetical protein E0F15_06680 [Frankia sp. B2]|nr:hypothetical protein E0F15_06680 [Frankia sp. B2]
MACGAWRAARGAWRVARGAWRVARGAWRVVRGVRREDRQGTPDSRNHRVRMGLNRSPAATCAPTPGRAAVHNKDVTLRWQPGSTPHWAWREVCCPGRCRCCPSPRVH